MVRSPFACPPRLPARRRRRSPRGLPRSGSRTGRDHNGGTNRTTGRGDHPGGGTIPFLITPPKSPPEIGGQADTPFGGTRPAQAERPALVCPPPAYILHARLNGRKPKRSLSHCKAWWARLGLNQ